MPGQRKRYSADLKSKIALEVIKAQKTANEIAVEYGSASDANCAMEKAGTRWLA